METLALKLNVLVGLFGYVGLFGLAALLVTLIWLIVRVANFDSVLPALLCVALSVALTVGGLILSPAPNAQPEPLRPPWEVPLEALKEQLGRFKENPPWARFLKDKEAGGENGELAGMEKLEDLTTVYNMDKERTDGVEDSHLKQQPYRKHVSYSTKQNISDGHLPA